MILVPRTSTVGVFDVTEKAENLATTLELPLSARSVVLKSIF